MVTITSRLWGHEQGAEVLLFRMENSQGAYIEITNYGATWVAAVVPDRHGLLQHVVAGFPDLESYIQDSCYIGSTIGRFANRISGAGFELSGTHYRLGANDGANSNHGGTAGFHKRVFDAKISGEKLEMHLLSPDGDGGYPGNLELKITYSWGLDQELHISYEATTDRETLANFTNHAYFNLSGFKETIHKHKLNIPAPYILHAWEDHIPSGAIVPVGGYDFRNDAQLSEKFKTDGIGMQGLNLYYILETDSDAMHPAAFLYEETSGRTLKVSTSYPGIFLYTGDYLGSDAEGHTGKAFVPYDGLCLECQLYPDSIHQPHFPQAILAPGQLYKQQIAFKFGRL